jgi:hypothetical protein
LQRIFLGIFLIHFLDSPFQMESAGFSPQDETIGCTSELREGRSFGAWNSVVNPVFSVAICKGTLLFLVLVAYTLPKPASVGHQ